jgi:hypothetical protein
MDTLELKKLFEKAVADHKPLILENIYSDVPSWDRVLKNIDYAYNTEKKNISIYNQMDLICFNALASVVLRDGSIFYDHNGLIPESDSLVKTLNEVIGKDAVGGKALINLVSNEADYWMHADDHDVISWQVLGKVEYRFSESKEAKPYLIHVLNPGDVVYIPTGVFHEVSILEPRATYIFQYLNENSGGDDEE